MSAIQCCGFRKWKNGGPISSRNSQRKIIMEIQLKKLLEYDLRTNIGLAFPSLQVLLLGGNRFTGVIPNTLSNVSNLQKLDIPFNNFTGNPMSFGNLQTLFSLNVPENLLGSGAVDDLNSLSSLANCSKLEFLDFSHNLFGGELTTSINNRTTQLNCIPTQLISISSLGFLNLSHNSLAGALPAEAGNLTNLLAVDVSYNQLSGEIPSKLGLCLCLLLLGMQGNFFQGTIPNLDQTGSHDLDLSSNYLYGQIPPYLANFSSLLYLNLSYNRLEGEVPIGGVFKNASAVEIVGINNLCGGIQELHLHPCHGPKPAKKRKHVGLNLILVIVIVSSCLALLLPLLLLFSRGKLKKKLYSTPSFGIFYQTITYKGLLDSTGGFSSGNIVGLGNFGAVYKGTLGPGATTVAVKVLNLQQEGASKSFMAECQALRNIRHQNLVRILTACSSTDFEGKDFKALVYQFMPNGSLEKWLHPEFGQTQRRVHCYLKPSNVLLDNDLTAHVSDFGLARFLSKFNKGASLNQFSSLGIKGTIGYTAPEFGVGGEVSTPGDVYSFGILLLEMFTGRSPVDERFKDSFNLHNFVKQSLSDQVMEIVAQSSLNEEVGQDSTDIVECGSDSKSEQKECLISVFQIGLRVQQNLHMIGWT
ncbi:unnamed protein product [Ilex paraguariensis]|uniref:Protein kinase domain-containing protein n=1 Tax=Ilex paraguariensis TaxID=185542 RepID=A0ABC8T475_9AQUA